MHPSAGGLATQPVDVASCPAAVLALLRSRLGAVVPALSVAADCKYAVKAPQLTALATANRALARIARAEFKARARSGQVHLAHVFGHSGDPRDELGDILADLDCCGKASHDISLSWLGDFRLPKLAPRARLSLHSLLF